MTTAGGSTATSTAPDARASAKHWKSSFDKAREAEGKEPWRPKDRPAQRAKDATAEMRDRKDFPRGDEQTTADVASAPAAGVDVSAPPQSWDAKSKQLWNQLPEAARAMIHRREVDSARGVEQLRAQYRELDEAIAPDLPTIRQFGHSPASSWKQMMHWFKSLQANPDVAFPALAKSFNYDLSRVVQRQQADPAQQQAAYLQQIIDQQIQQRIAPLAQTFEQQQAAHANQILAEFSKDKPHFERVRAAMAHLLTSGIVPLTPEGNVDLSRAYETAIWQDPEIRNELLAEQRAAERTKQKEQAQRARYAGSSLGSSSPGAAATSAARSRSRAEPSAKALKTRMSEAREG